MGGVTQIGLVVHLLVDHLHDGTSLLVTRLFHGRPKSNIRFPDPLSKWNTAPWLTPYVN